MVPSREDCIAQLRAIGNADANNSYLINTGEGDIEVGSPFKTNCCGHSFNCCGRIFSYLKSFMENRNLNVASERIASMVKRVFLNDNLNNDEALVCINAVNKFNEMARINNDRRGFAKNLIFNPPKEEVIGRAIEEESKENTKVQNDTPVNNSTTVIEEIEELPPSNDNNSQVDDASGDNSTTYVEEEVAGEEVVEKENATLPDENKVPEDETEVTSSSEPTDLEGEQVDESEKTDNAVTEPATEDDDSLQNTEKADVEDTTNPSLVVSEEGEYEGDDEGEDEGEDIRIITTRHGIYRVKQ